MCIGIMKDFEIISPEQSQDIIRHMKQRQATMHIVTINHKVHATAKMHALHPCKCT